jgi:cysteine desulfurase/selenocysteine lyase
MNIGNIKKEFPIFNNKVNNNDLVYLDSANSSQKPQVVIDRIYDFYSKEFSNVGRSVHYLAVAATNMYENTRSSVQKYINAKDKNEVVFTKGATEAINLVASTFGQKFLKEGDEILLTELEHHSNYVPWHYLRKTKGIRIEFAEVNDEGEVTLDNIEKKITSKTKMIAVTHLSNVTGAILPIKEIVALAHSKNIPVLIDGCQGAPHLKLDMQDLDCDFYAISCHKMYGPTGLGVLYAKKKWLEELPPYQGGGGMIREVKKEGITYGDLPNKYEAGTMATAQVIAFNESIKFLKKIGINNIATHEKELIDYGQEILRKNNSVSLIGNPKKKGAVLSFTLDGIHAHDIATILDEDGVAIRAGHHCCQILHDKLGVSATARASLGVYNTKEDLDKLNESINKCKKIFNTK